MEESNCPHCGGELPKAARFCPFCGRTLSVSEESDREERRVVTALFADVVGSTSLGERLDPEDFRGIMGGAVDRMGKAIEEFGGTVQGSAGDGVIGLFGTPTAREDDPERAVLAGLGLIDRITEHGTAVADEFGIDPLAVRVGIETGLTVVGAYRAGSQEQYSASGDCLNTAARLQGEADPGGVLVGPLTQRLVAPLFEWEEPRSLSLKGKAEPVVARQVRDIREAGRRREARGARSRLVGRDRELAHAEEAVNGALAGEGRILIVTGEPGIGKTRIVDEVGALFAAAGAGGSQPRWLEGHCVSYAEDQPYLPFRGLLAAALEQVGEQPDAADPFLRSIMGLALEAEEATRLEALSQESLWHGVLTAVAALIERLAADGPIAIFLDDLHWADASSIRLASELTALITRLPLLLVFAMRPERDAGSWGLRELALSEHGQRTLELALEPIAAEAERSLVAELIGAETLPEHVERRLLERSEGNPLYLEELVRSLLDAGALVRTGDGWRFDPAASFELPENVERVVLARIDRLEPKGRDLLTAASVLGRQFDLSLLRRITRDERLSEESVSGLVDLGLLEDEAPGLEYRFKHPLIQQAAYNSLLRSGRAQLHGRAAAAIEEMGASEEHYPLLARHHRGAGNKTEAVRYHGLAGKAAARVYAGEEALRHFDAALEISAEPSVTTSLRDVAELRLERGQVRARTGDYQVGVEDVRASVKGATEAGDEALRVRALTDLGWLTRGSAYEEAVGYHEDALAAAEQLGDDTTQVTALSRLSMIASNRLQLDRGLELGERALKIARRKETGEVLGRALDCTKLAAFQLGDLDRLEATASEMASVQRRTGDLYYLQWALSEVALVPMARGSHDEAIRLIEEAQSLTAELRDKLGGGMMLEARSWIERSSGELGAAVSGCREASAVVSELGIPEWIAWTDSSLGSHLLALRAAESARAPLEGALELAEQVGSPNRMLRAGADLAWAYSLLRDDDRARKAADDAEKLIDQISAPRGMAFLNGYHAYLAVARVRLAQGEPERAPSILEPMRKAARAVGWHEADAYAGMLIGRAHADRADRDRAASELEAALAAAERGAAPGPAWEAHAALAELRAAEGATTEADRDAAEARSIVERIAASVDDIELRDRFVNDVLAVGTPETPLKSASPAAPARRGP